jgi:hypothetical protein
MDLSFDLVVVGGGHAGIEAAHAGWRMGLRSALVSLSNSAIGRMSCNPAMVAWQRANRTRYRCTGWLNGSALPMRQGFNFACSTIPKDLRFGGLAANPIWKSIANMHSDI